MEGVVLLTKKKRISASIKPELKDRLDQLEEINKSQLVETLLQEYLAQGESTTVALKLLREDLRRKKDNKQIEKRMIENEIASLDDQINEVTQKIKERREAGLDGVDEIVEKVEEGRMSPEFIHSNNPVIKEKASKAGVPPKRFAKEVNSQI